ncbi:MAG: GNAT family N-acetyltransferase [Verrucomicrobiota bacterium]
MELRPYADEHRWLTEALELDPDVMRELGGPADQSDLDRVHRMRVETVARGEWYFVIVPDPSAPPVGAIGIWESSLSGSAVHEVGWMVLPEFQGRGIASEALGLLISRARSDPRYARIHAFPGTTNAPSNALCRKHGFTLTEATEVEFRDRPLRVNHWELDVS